MSLTLSKKDPSLELSAEQEKINIKIGKIIKKLRPRYFILAILNIM
jgi:hypothetical protein